jgi:hypothetical protein
MAVTTEADNTPLPGTVFTPRQVRVLKIAVIVMGVLLVGGFSFVMAAIVYQASNLGEKKSPLSGVAPAPQGELRLPQGASLTSMALDGDRLALHLKTDAGSEIAVIDIVSGKVLSRIPLGADKP